MFDELTSSDLVEVNRSFWTLHYGQGTSFASSRLGSSNLTAGFYRGFARNIDFNFTYQTLSDEGWLPLQSNSFRNLDFKIHRPFKRCFGDDRLLFLGVKMKKASNERTITGLYRGRSET